MYCWWIFLSPYAPGAPGITPPEGTFSELFNESINYFYVNIFLNAVHLPGISANAVRSLLLRLLPSFDAWACPCRSSSSSCDQCSQLECEQLPGKQQMRQQQASQTLLWRLQT